MTHCFYIFKRFKLCALKKEWRLGGGGTQTTGTTGTAGQSSLDSEDLKKVII